MNNSKIELGMDHFIFEGGGVGQLPKKNSCIAKVKKKKSCTVGQGKKKFEQAFLLVGSC